MIPARTPRARRAAPTTGLLAAAAFASILQLGLAGCTKSPAAQQPKLQRPSSAVVFRGLTSKVAGVHPYLAIANEARSELVLVDAADDQAVLAPIQFRPLEVPVADPAPARLAAVSLADEDAGGAPLPDLLVVAAEGSSDLQVIRTWVSATTAGEVVPLPAGARVLSLLGVPVPDVSGTSVVPGRARILAGLTGGRLAVVDFARSIGTDGLPAIVASAPVILDLGFDAVSLAVPFDPVWRRSGDAGGALGPDNLAGLLTRLYAASPDPINGTFGVARFDTSGLPAAWPATVTTLDTRGAPTRLVAAWRLRERKPAVIAVPSLDPLDYETDNYPGSEFEPVGVERVYAVLEQPACGLDRRVPCGIAVLDPVSGGLRADPYGEMPYLPPIVTPAEPVALAVSAPPVAPPTTTASSPERIYGGATSPYEKLLTTFTARATTAVMAVPGENGAVYFVDLARWAIHSETSVLRARAANTTRGLTVSVAGTNPTDTATDRPLLGLENGATVYTDSTTGSAADKKAALESVRTTPGYGPVGGVAWTVRKEGLLPGLELTRAETGGDASPWVALQERTNGAISRYGRLYDPTTGVRIGDRVILVPPTAVAGCTVDTTTGAPPLPELVVTGFLAPDAARPGGAVTVSAGDTTPPACLAALGGGASVHVQVRAGALVLTNDVVGYVGRPVFNEAGAAPAVAYALAYSNEDAAAAACPILPWPATLASASPAFFTCTDAACRDACQRLVEINRARRTYYVSERCRVIAEDAAIGEDDNCRAAWPAAEFPWPAVTGPVLSFTVSAKPVAATTTVPSPLPATYANLVRNAQVRIFTTGGVTFSFRSTPRNLGTANQPTGVTVFDRSRIPGKEADLVRYYVPYLNAVVLDTSPAALNNSAGVVR